MKRIIQILMGRDDQSYEEAREVYLNTRTDIMDAINSARGLVSEEVLMNELGLEMNYVFDFA